MRYSRLLEENSFSNRKADYIWLLSLCAMFLLVSLAQARGVLALTRLPKAASYFLMLPFLSSSLAFALVYIWSRRNPYIQMSLFGVVT